jgi:hypothetical protein
LANDRKRERLAHVSGFFTGSEETPDISRTQNKKAVISDGFFVFGIQVTYYFFQA